MKKNLLNKLWLRVGMIVAIMTTALSGTAWAETTYKLQQVTSVEAGGLYVFEQSSRVMNNTCASSALQTTDSYSTSGLTGTETYVWTLEVATGGFYMKNTNGTGNYPYLNNTSRTNVSFGTSGSSVWSFTFQTDNTVLIQNTSSSNRYLGYNNTTDYAYKAYATSDMSYLHAIKVYQLVEEGGTLPTTYTITFDAGDGTFVGSADFPNTLNSKEAGTYTLPSATRDGYTFDGWLTTGSTEPVNGSYIVSGDVDFTAQYTENAIPTPIGDLTIDFESAASTYTDWTFASMESQQTGSITAHGGTYYGTTGGKATASIATKAKVATPNTLTCYVSKQTANTTSSTWYIQVSEDGTTWTNVASQSATSMSKGTWVEFTADLTSYNDVYVRVYYSGSTAVRNIDDLTLTTSAKPIITADNVSIAYNETSGSTTYTITNPAADGILSVPNNGNIPDWISEITYPVNTNIVTIYCSENTSTTERSATITLVYTYNGTETVTKEITVTQAGNPNGPGTENNPYTVAQALAAPTASGVYVTGIISTITEVSTEHGNATYRISDDGTTNNEMIIYRGKYLENAAFTSADQIHVGDVVVVTGNLSVYNEVNQLAQGNHIVSIASTSATPIINAADVTLAYNATSGEIAYTITNPADGVTLDATTDADWISNIVVTADKVTFSTTANETGSVRTATFTLAYTGATDKTITVTQEKLVVNGNYTLATFITSGKKYVIASGAEGTVQVMGDQNSNNRGAVEATITNSVLTVSDDCEFVIESVTGGYSIYDEDVPGYLYAAGSDKNYLRTQAENNVDGIWTITFITDGDEAGSASVVAAGSSNRNVMQYNPNTSNNNPLFSCYASASQSPVYLFEKVESQTVKVTSARYATFVAAADLEIPANVEVFAVTVNDGAASAHLNPISGGIPAGEAVLVRANADTYEFPYTSETVAPITNNDLKASTVAFNPTAENTIYCLANKSNGIGFYPVATSVLIPAGKAYLNLSAVGGVKAFYGFEEEDPTGISNLNANVNANEGAIYNLSGQMVNGKLPKGIYIVNGKKILK